MMSDVIIISVDRWIWVISGILVLGAIAACMTAVYFNALSQWRKLRKEGSLITNRGTYTFKVKEAENE